MKRNDIVRLTIESILPDGSGYAVAEGREIAVKGALPGDVIDARILALKRTSARVRVESVVSREIERIPAACPHFDICGGCRWQDVPYDVQCSFKADIVRRELGSIPGLPPCEIDGIVPSPDMFYYRNKMEYSFDSPPYLENELFLGLHEAGRFDRVFNLTDCRLQSEASNRAVEAVRSFAVDNGLSAYGLKSHAGLLRYLMIRDGKNTGELMVNLVTSGDDFTGGDALVEAVMTQVPSATTIIRSINTSKGGITTGEAREILTGEGVIKETIGGLTFTVSPDSFFQTNPRQTENLYACIREFCSLSGAERVLDLYCGTGTIGMFIAEGAESVAGIELVEDAVADARMNAERNGIENIQFTAGKVEDIVDGTQTGFDIVICDPPRAGIHPKALAQLIRMKIPRMVYVSCNIKALPHDLEMLALAGYSVREVRAFDMSPHTPHVETVVKLEIR